MSESGKHDPGCGATRFGGRLPAGRRLAAALLLAAAATAEPQVFGAIPRDAPGAVETDVRPKRAALRVDGEFVGQARDYNDPWNLLWLEPGEHVLEFGKEGYRTLRRRLDIRSGMHVRIVERLEKGEGLDPRSSPETPPPAIASERDPRGRSDPPARPALEAGFLRLAVEPPDAAVYLDGEFLARSDELRRMHGALAVAPGPHRVEVVRPGYVSRTLEVVVEAGEPLEVELELERDAGSAGER